MIAASLMLGGCSLFGGTKTDIQPSEGNVAVTPWVNLQFAKDNGPYGLSGIFAGLFGMQWFRTRTYGGALRRVMAAVEHHGEHGKPIKAHVRKQNNGIRWDRVQRLIHGLRKA